MPVRIEHFALFAQDPATLKDFYVQTFGLRVIVDNASGAPPGFFLADEGGTALEIIGRPAGAEEVNQRYVCHLALLVEDIAAMRAKLEGMGLTFETDTIVDNDAMTTCFFRDPEGNRIQIVKRHRPLGS